MPTVLDNFIVIAKHEALANHHAIGRMTRYGKTMATADCKNCGGRITVNINSGKPVQGIVATEHCTESKDATAQQG